MASCEVGLMGLAVMGQNLALNIAEKGFRIAVCNRTLYKVDDTVARAKNEGNLPLVGYKDLISFVNAIKTPRKIIILVQAGSAVDEIIRQLIPLLDKGDVLIDGGNEWYELTEERMKKMEHLGFRYMGMGISGGEEGARHGPALMPGGSPSGYELMKPILDKIAAQVDDGPCVSFIGKGGAGHYVKMVHNGVEYGDMQLIAEAYILMKTHGHLDNEEMHSVFKEWNEGPLESFLVEITANILKQKDEFNPEEFLVDKILDVAGSKGTGMWTVQEAAKRGVPCPTIQAALDMRYMSRFKAQRLNAARLYPKQPSMMEHKEQLLSDIQDALYCSKVCSYTQGMMLLQVASQEEQWDLKLDEIARGWKGGCIIRANFLNRIQTAYIKNPELPSLLLDHRFSEEISNRLPGWRRIVSLAQQSGIAIPALSSSLGYFDAYTSTTLPVNLVQAQRDYFGAHTYSRNDHREGEPFHTKWNSKI